MADAMRVGVPVAVGAPMLAPTNNVSAGGARARRLEHPKLMQDGSHAGRPWRGPLPPVRVSPARSLGDIWVTDRRSGVGGRTCEVR
jgi:hypothetical protein